DRIAEIKSEVDIAQYETQKQAVEEGAEKAGQQVKEVSKVEKAKLLKEQGYKGQELTSLTDDVAGMYNAKEKTIYIDKETALEVGEINVAGHELLHPVLNKLIGDDAAQGKIVEDFKKQLTQKDLAWMEDEMKSRGYGINSGKYNTEYISVFSDGITKTKVEFNESAFGKIGDVIAGVFKGVGFKNIHFKDGRGVHNFLKAYHEGLDSGKFDQDVTAFLEKSKGMKDKLAAKGQLSQASNPYSEFTPEDLILIKESPSSKQSEIQLADQALLDQFDLLALKALKYDTRKGDFRREDVLSAARAELPGIIERFDPNTAKFSTFVTNTMRPKQQQIYEEVKSFQRPNESLDSPEAKQVAAPKPSTPKTESKVTQAKIDPTKFDGVTDKISLKYKVDQKPTKAQKKLENKPDKDLTVKEIGTKATGVVGEQIFNIPANKITGKFTILTLQEARKVQQFFGRSDNLSRFLKIAPKFNVATNVTQVGLEKLDVPKNIKGIALGINDSVLDLMYDDYVDPTGEMTSPSGRSKGSKSQPQVKILKPEFRGTIKKETLDRVRAKIGIMPTGEVNNLPRGAERSPMGKTLKGMAKLFSQLTATTLVRKTSKATAKELIPSKAGLRDVQFSAANRDLAKKLLGKK
ncbi:MAG: hypothetical protein GY928_19170, partial [Colwellia sp.]|nr:hypothetical protein [Colwellia sp.]